MSSEKSKKERSEEQRLISSFMSRLQVAVNVYDHELGDGKNVPKFIQHDGYTYSVVLSDRKKLKFKIEVE